MKKVVSLFILSMVVMSGFAQSGQLKIEQSPRTLQVRGVAEREVTPDVLYFSISLREYFRDNSNKVKVSIDVLEKQLYQAAMNAGIPAGDFTIDNVSSYQTILNRKKKDPGFLASKQYRIKVSNLDAVNSLFEAVDDKGIHSSRIDGYEYSKKSELERELKIQAVRDAKEKAIYMAEALGDKIGLALSVSESGYINYPQPVARSFAQSSKLMSSDMAAAPESLEIDFKKVKFSFEVNVLFQLVGDQASSAIYN